MQIMKQTLRYDVNTRQMTIKAQSAEFRRKNKGCEQEFTDNDEKNFDAEQNI